MSRAVVVWLVLLLPGGAYAQQPVWDLQEDLGGPFDAARALTLSPNEVVAVGNGISPDGTVNFVVQALWRSTGTTQWSDTVPVDSGLTGVFVTSLHETVFAAGYAHGASDGTDIFVRAYDSHSGRLMWENVWDAGQDDLPKAIAASSRAVVVVGAGGNTPGSPILHFMVRALDPATGTVLWDDVVGVDNFGDAAYSVAFDNTRVFVAGTAMVDSPTDRELMLRAYNASSGVLRWDIRRPATSVTSVKAGAGMVVVGGESSGNAYLGAFAARTGGLLWEVDDDTPGLVRDVGLDDSRVIAAGQSGSEWLVRAYDRSSGTLQWEDRLGDSIDELANTVATNGRTVYVGGSTGRFDSQILVRAYTGESGTLLWDDRSHPTFDGTGSVATGMALGKNRLFVAGGGQGDFVVRAYDIRNDGEQR